MRTLPDIPKNRRPQCWSNFRAAQGDAADDLLLVAWECPAEDVDVAGDATRAELSEQESALEDEVLLAEWVDADAVEEAFGQGARHSVPVPDPGPGRAVH
jgi:hypothetical protein